MFNQTAAGMHTLYDSDDFIVVHMQSHAAINAADTAPLHGRDHLALARHGFEIVDKRSGKEVYLDGSWAEMFQKQIVAWQLDAPSEEEVEETLDRYTGLAQQPVIVH